MNRGVMFEVDGIKKHSIADFGLIMSPPKISHPVVKTKEIDIPGSDGTVDLMQFITDIPHYENRKVDITFRITRRGKPHENIVTAVSNFLNGRYAKITFDENPEYYFYGRCSISDGLTHNEGFGSFSVSVNAQPYKYAVQTIDEPYLWDSFNLESGIIYSEFLCGDTENENKVVKVPINNSGTNINVSVIKMPVEPTITVYGYDCILTYNGESYTLKGTSSGKENIPIGLILQEGNHTLHFELAESGTYSNVTVNFRNGVF